jgi:chromosome segregation ATPase
MEDFEFRKRAFEIRIEEIEKELDELSESKQHINRKLINAEWDIEHARRDDSILQQEINNLKKEKKDLDDRYRNKEQKLEITIVSLKQFKRQGSKWFRWARFQAESEKTAERKSEAYNKDEIRDIIQNDYDEEDMLQCALKLKRTFYGIEHIVRARYNYLNQGNLPFETINNLVKEVIDEDRSF